MLQVCNVLLTSLRCASSTAICRAHCAASGLTKLQMMDSIKMLRAQTGAPIGDVKKALEKTNFDMQLASDTLRTMGVAAVAKKASRAATEGLVGVAQRGNTVALAELSCETDFVARNKQFSGLLPHLASQAVACSIPPGVQSIDLDHLTRETMPDGRTVEEAVQEVGAAMRENISLRRAICLHSPSGHVVSYVHNTLRPGVGTVAGAVSLEAEGMDLSGEVPPRVKEIGKQLAMQVVAMAPVSVDRNGVPAEMVEKESALLTEQAQNEGDKPAAIIEKIVTGRMKKFYEEIVLNDQSFILDDKVSVGNLVNEVGIELGMKLKIGSYAYLKVGDKS